MIEVREFLNYGYSEFEKRGFLLNEKDLTYIQPHLEALDLPEHLQKFIEESQKAIGKQRRVRKRVIAVIVVILVLLTLAVFGFIYASQQRAEALNQKQLAEQNAQLAQNQKEAAEQNAQLALSAQQNAELSAEEATKQAAIAEEQRQLADFQKNSAELSRIEAENQRKIALVQKDSAEVARSNALVYLEDAKRERGRAETLSMQVLARSLGIKSTQLPDLQLKSLLAFQAYQFNNEFGGYEFQGDIYQGIIPGL